MKHHDSVVYSLYDVSGVDVICILFHFELEFSPPFTQKKKKEYHENPLCATRMWTLSYQRSFEASF